MQDFDIKKAFSAFQSTPLKPIEPVSTTSNSGGKMEAKATPVTGRLNYTEVGVCPYCNEPTKKVECCGQTVFLCESDRFVSPLPNSEQTS
jgi:hypothetical protein